MWKCAYSLHIPAYANVIATSKCRDYTFFIKLLCFRVHQHIHTQYMHMDTHNTIDNMHALSSISNPAFESVNARAFHSCFSERVHFASRNAHTFHKPARHPCTYQTCMHTYGGVLCGIGLSVRMHNDTSLCLYACVWYSRECVCVCLCTRYVLFYYVLTLHICALDARVLRIGWDVSVLRDARRTPQPTG